MAWLNVFRYDWPMQRAEGESLVDWGERVVRELTALAPSVTARANAIRSALSAPYLDEEPPPPMSPPPPPIDNPNTVVTLLVGHVNDLKLLEAADIVLRQDGCVARDSKGLTRVQGLSVDLGTIVGWLVRSKEWRMCSPMHERLGLAPEVELVPFLVPGNEPVTRGEVDSALANLQAEVSGAVVGISPAQRQEASKLSWDELLSRAITARHQVEAAHAQLDLLDASPREDASGTYTLKGRITAMTNPGGSWLPASAIMRYLLRDSHPRLVLERRDLVAVDIADFSAEFGTKIDDGGSDDEVEEVSVDQTAGGVTHIKVQTDNNARKSGRTARAIDQALDAMVAGETVRMTIGRSEIDEYAKRIAHRAAERGVDVNIEAGLNRVRGISGGLVILWPPPPEVDGATESPQKSNYVVFDQYGDFRGRVFCLDECEAITTIMDHDDEYRIWMKLKAISVPWTFEERPS